jgi:hypothetical protein
MRIYLVFDSESNSDARQVKAFISAAAANRYYEQSQANEMLSVNVDGVAEAAERTMEAWLAWCDSGNVDGTWDAFVSAVTDYKSAREAVRKLEEQT